MRAALKVGFGMMVAKKMSTDANEMPMRVLLSRGKTGAYWNLKCRTNGFDWSVAPTNLRHQNQGVHILGTFEFIHKAGRATQEH